MKLTLVEFPFGRTDSTFDWAYDVHGNHWFKPVGSSQWHPLTWGRPDVPAKKAPSR